MVTSSLIKPFFHTQKEARSLEIYSIELQPPATFPEVFQEPCFVYLLVENKRRGILINLGPYACRNELLLKLEELYISPNAIERIFYTNWDPRHIGDLASFPQAIPCALSPDGVRPYNYAAILEYQRTRLRRLISELYGENSAPPGLPKTEEEALVILDSFINDYFDQLPPILPVVPLRNGDVLNLFGLSFHVMDHSSYYKGQMSLYNKEEGLLFGLSLPTIGLPNPFYSLAAVTPMIDRIASLNCRILATNHAGIETRPDWFLKRARAFVKSFIENSPVALRKQPTLLEFIEQNFGFTHTSIVDYLFELIKYQDVLNELARDEDIAIHGAGITQRRYGINIVDSRHPRLRK